MQNSIIEEKFETAKEFLETLRITNSRWISIQNNWESSWIFRGQANAKWHLIPSAWPRLDLPCTKLERFKQKYRAKFENNHLVALQRELDEITNQIERGEITADEGKEKANTRSKQTNYHLEQSLQHYSEMQAVKEFTEFADRLGHPVPGANEFIVNQQPVFRSLPEDSLIDQFDKWSEHRDPFNVDCSAVALAQHHGVPTRLLDWTENPLIAAFFAAEEFTSGKRTDKKFNSQKGRIAVWAISKEIFSGSEKDRTNPSPLQIIVRPRHEISYLFAQKAVFTHDKSANDWFEQTGKWRSIEEAIGNDPEYLKKLTLPVKEVGELLRLLWLEDISRAHLMPTYDNVTHTLATNAWWKNR